MTFNVRHATDPTPNSWEERLPLIRELLQRENPDLIGTQECYYHQIKDMLSVLPDYDYIGLGREGGSRGEYSAIFYRRDRFDVLEYDHYWLSDTPGLIGSTTWNHEAPRMVTWGRFRELDSGLQFYVCNTHMDHLSEEARIKGAALLAERTEEFDSALPVLITGDFNVGPDSESYRILHQGGFADTWNSAAKRGGEDLGSFNNFKDPLGNGPTWRIDWIMTRGGVQADSIRIVDDHREGRFPSDHFPVMAEMRLSY
jgi:endonuclease/exonuclease/phosphatase family metal-dependent hydrolase